MDFCNKGSVSAQTKGIGVLPNYEILFPACMPVPTREPPYVDPKCQN